MNEAERILADYINMETKPGLEFTLGQNLGKPGGHY